ncbi:MAG TPA: helix-turn-helix domain-containing protein [Solirubrobacteraceae bacterium]|jgi:DNA-binding transcriptional ArsR family regulator|nr:helix-turn-helix domain-containing protein [Solirubrobacteraceae bacterium]
MRGDVDLPDLGEAHQQLRDPRGMRALAHPVRLALMDALSLEGELTATQAAQIVGESPANCSFHFRQLAKYGFVEEAGGGTGRQRPWRLKTLAITLDIEDASETATAVAGRELLAILQEQAIARLRNWTATQWLFPKRWRKAFQAKQALWWVTPQELEQLGEEMLALMLRYSDRLQDPSRRPEGALPVEFLGFAYPLRPPGGQPDGRARASEAEADNFSGG